MSEKPIATISGQTMRELITAYALAVAPLTSPQSELVNRNLTWFIGKYAYGYTVEEISKEYTRPKRASPSTVKRILAAMTSARLYVSIENSIAVELLNAMSRTSARKIKEPCKKFEPLLGRDVNINGALWFCSDILQMPVPSIWTTDTDEVAIEAPGEGWHGIAERSAENSIRRHGAALLPMVAHACSEATETFHSTARVRDYLCTLPGYEELDASRGWFWFGYQHDNGICNVADRILATGKSVGFDSIYSGYAKVSTSARAVDLLAPRKVARRVLAQHPELYGRRWLTHLKPQSNDQTESSSVLLRLFNRVGFATVREVASELEQHGHHGTARSAEVKISQMPEIYFLEPNLIGLHGIRISDPRLEDARRRRREEVLTRWREGTIAPRKSASGAWLWVTRRPKNRRSRIVFPLQIADSFIPGQYTSPNDMTVTVFRDRQEKPSKLVFGAAKLLSEIDVSVDGLLWIEAHPETFEISIRRVTADEEFELTGDIAPDSEDDSVGQEA